MADLQAQRTLVKSPPELWAELSNPESLSRRLADFGEIRITRLVPEKTVAWEGERASGTVELESAGWGTKVRLTASSNAAPAVADRPIAAVDRITAVIEESQDPADHAGEAAQEQAEEAPVERTIDAPAVPVSRVAPPLMPPVRAGFGPAERSSARVARRLAAAAAEQTAAAERAGQVAAAEQAAAEQAAAEQATAAEQTTAAKRTGQAAAPVTPPAPAAASRPVRRGFLAWLFGRRRTARARRVAGPATAPAVVSSAAPTPSEPPTAPVVVFRPAPPPEPAAAAAVVLPAAPPPDPTRARIPAAEPSVGAAPEPSAASEAAPTARYAAPMPASTPDPPEPRSAGARPAASGPAALDPEQTMAVLSGVLDDLGAAHHRPFSRE